MPPGETLHNYLFKAVLTGNASLVVKALLAGADPNAPCSTQARAHLVQYIGSTIYEGQRVSGIIPRAKLVATSRRTTTRVTRPAALSSWDKF